MRFASLGSGSEGNALVAEAGATRLLVDCGFSPRETGRRLQRLGLLPADLSGIVVTHEHSDHMQGVAACARRFGLPVWLTHGTLSALREQESGDTSGLDLQVVSGEREFRVGTLEVLPYTVPHDAREPVQYVFSDGRKRLGVLTDIGCVTPLVQEVLAGCDALVLEANHDLDMLWRGSYPPALKSRIASRQGHMDNGSAAGLLASLNHDGLQCVVAAHLSQKNNAPDLARAAFANALGWSPDRVDIAAQDAGLDWRSIG